MYLPFPLFLSILRGMRLSDRQPVMLFVRTLVSFLIFLLVTAAYPPSAPAREMESFPVVKLQSLDKITARTITFEARVGSTIKFGPLYIKIQACQKAPPVEPPESAAFLQIWQVTPKGGSEWVFSGWMFASSPALSYMDHPIYDVWVLDCLEKKTRAQDKTPPAAKEGEGVVADDKVPVQPGIDGGPSAPSSDLPPEENGEIQE